MQVKYDKRRYGKHGELEITLRRLKNWSDVTKSYNRSLQNLPSEYLSLGL